MSIEALKKIYRLFSVCTPLNLVGAYHLHPTDVRLTELDIMAFGVMTHEYFRNGHFTIQSAQMMCIVIIYAASVHMQFLAAYSSGVLPVNL